jgi:hypothetical protein
VDKPVLLAMVRPQREARVEDSLGGVHGLIPAKGDKALAEILF